jgi:hypothetical protein
MMSIATTASKSMPDKVGGSSVALGGILQIVEASIDVLAKRLLICLPLLCLPSMIARAQCGGAPNGTRSLASQSASTSAKAGRTDSQSAPLAGTTIQLTPVLSTTTQTSTIVAPGRGLQRYRIYYLDVTSFSGGGTLDIDIQVSPSSATDGSFDLFPANLTIPRQGRPVGSLAGRYDVRKGTGTRLEYHFQTGQKLAFGLEGNWGSAQGLKGIATFTASVNGEQPVTLGELDLQPIIYGPTMPDPNTVGVCVYLGARKQESSNSQTTYNWVQRISASDAIESKGKTGCVYPHDERGYFGNSSYFIDNCADSDPSYAVNSDLYRNGNARFFTGALNPSWIDLKDSKPFDYLFVDIPMRTIGDIDKVTDGKDSGVEDSDSACGGSDTSSILSSIVGGLSRLSGSRKLRWCAVLTPVLVGTDCPVDRQVTTRNGIKLSRPYCKLSPQPVIRYGFTVSRISIPLAKNPQGAYYKVVLDPLTINGKPVAPSRTYIMNFIETSENHYKHRLYTDLKIYNLPMTVDQEGQEETICNHAIKKDAWNHPLPAEPMKFRQPFTP